MCAMLSILDFAGEATDSLLELANVSQFRLMTESRKNHASSVDKSQR